MPERNAKPAYDRSKAMSRQRHLELLVFELLSFIEHELGTLTNGSALESSRFEEVRVLYKSLAHDRRPDGSRY